MNLHDTLKSKIAKYAVQIISQEGLTSLTRQIVCGKSEQMLSDLESTGAIVSDGFVDNMQTADAIPVSDAIIRGEATINALYEIIRWSYNLNMTNWIKQKQELELLKNSIIQQQDEVTSLIALSERSDGFLSNVLAKGDTMVTSKSTARYEPVRGLITCPRKTNNSIVVAPDKIKSISAKILTPGFINYLEPNNTSYEYMIDNDPTTSWVFTTFYPLTHNDPVQIEAVVDFKEPENIFGITVDSPVNDLDVDVLVSADGKTYAAIDRGNIVKTDGLIVVGVDKGKVIRARIIFTLRSPSAVLPEGKKFTLMVRNIAFNKAAYATKAVAILGPFKTTFPTDNIKVALSADDIQPDTTSINYYIGMRSTDASNALHFKPIVPINKDGEIKDKIVYTPFTNVPLSYEMIPCVVDLTVSYPYFSRSFMVLNPNNAFDDGTLDPEETRGLYLLRYFDDRHYTETDEKSYYVSYCFIDSKDGLLFDGFVDVAYVDQQKITSPVLLKTGWHTLAIPHSQDPTAFEDWLAAKPVRAGFELLTYAGETAFVNNPRDDLFTIIVGHDTETDTDIHYLLLNKREGAFDLLSVNKNSAGTGGMSDKFNTDLVNDIQFIPQEYYIKAELNGTPTISPVIKSVGLRFSTYKA